MKAFVSAVFQAINRVLEIFGLRLLRTNAPVRNFGLFFKHLKSLGFEVRTVIDVGIAFGTSPIYDAFPRASYFLVEPVAECRPVLEKLKQRLNAEYFLVAAGAENGEVTFNVHDDISGSSMFSAGRGQGARRRSAAAPDAAARIHCCRKRWSIPYSSRSIRRAPRSRCSRAWAAGISEIDLLILETTMMPMRHGIPQFADIVRFCDEAGFAVYDVLEGHMRALDGALAQIDLAFVRKDSALRSQAAYFDPDQLADYLKRPSKLRGAKD